MERDEHEQIVTLRDGKRDPIRQSVRATILLGCLLTHLLTGYFFLYRPTIRFCSDLRHLMDD
jgi:hypothetical protein